MAVEIARGSATSTLAGADLFEFLDNVRGAIGIDLRAYKADFLVPRLERRMQARGFSDARAYAVQIVRDRGERQFLRDNLTARVSSFFRDQATFEVLRNDVVAAWPGRVPEPRVWSAAAGPGQELYSVAILLAEAGQLNGASLLGTDLSRSTLAQARLGEYSVDEIAGLPPPLQRRYFRVSGRRAWLAESLRDAVVWQEQDVLTTMPEGPFELVLCRNFAIYLRSNDQAALYDRLAERVVSGGYLAVGTSERIATAPTLGLRRAARGLYLRARIGAGGTAP